jgi:hypothetical protein
MAKQQFLTPERGRAVAYLEFKHEDAIRRVPVGPAGIVYKDQLLANGQRDPQTMWRTFDPNREPDPWFKLPDIERLARELGVEVRES